jgi:hypothetical protein
LGPRAQSRDFDQRANQGNADGAIDLPDGSGTDPKGTTVFVVRSTLGLRLGSIVAGFLSVDKKNLSKFCATST